MGKTGTTVPIIPGMYHLPDWMGSHSYPQTALFEGTL